MFAAQAAEGCLSCESQLFHSLEPRKERKSTRKGVGCLQYILSPIFLLFFPPTLFERREEQLFFSIDFWT